MGGKLGGQPPPAFMWPQEGCTCSAELVFPLDPCTLSLAGRGPGPPKPGGHSEAGWSWSLALPRAGAPEELAYKALSLGHLSDVHSCHLPSLSSLFLSQKRYDGPHSRHVLCFDGLSPQTCSASLPPTPSVKSPQFCLLGEALPDPMFNTSVCVTATCIPRAI